jgi:hypothetical protein
MSCRNKGYVVDNVLSSWPRMPIRNQIIIHGKKHTSIATLFDTITMHN